MKKALCLIVVMLLLSSCVTGNAGHPDNMTVTPKPTESILPGTSPEPASQPSDVDSFSQTLYYPEDSDEDTAQYRLTYSIPVFEDSTPAGAAMNEAVARYMDSLLVLVSQERVPRADRADGEPLPSTDVSYELSYARGYTNVIFNSISSYGVGEELGISTLVLDGRGNERPLQYVSGVYSGENNVAQAILSDVASAVDGNYFHDVTIESVLRAIDLYNGYTVEDFGYRIYVLPASLAPESEGILSFDVTTAEAAPGFVGDVISVDAIYALLPRLNSLATALAVNYESYTDGMISPYAATIYACIRLIDENPGVSGSVVTTRDELIEIISTSLGIESELDLSAWGIKENADSLSVSTSHALSVYGVDISDVTASDGGVLLLKGTLHFGAAGSAASQGYVSTVEIEIIPSAASECGYIISAFKII